MAQISPRSVRTCAAARRTSYPVASADTSTHVAHAPGGDSPEGASPDSPGSTTRATRLESESDAGPVQMSANADGVRGGSSPSTPLVANRHPSTSPSLGMREPAPTAEKSQEPPAPVQ